MGEGHKGFGKWGQAGVPKKGWVCVGVEDLEEPSEICGMCEAVEIRYVHYMEHSDYDQILGVGCICAEHMEEDYKNPKLREQKLKSQAYRRKTWPNKKWRLSAMRNPYLNIEGYCINIVPAKSLGHGKWRISITNKGSRQSQYGRKIYHSEEEAKEAALDALLWAKDNLE